MSSTFRITWSSQEKVALLSGLQKYGPDNIRALQNCLPNKTIVDIRKRIKIYRHLSKNFGPTKKSPNKARSRYTVWPNVVVLDKWVQIFSVNNLDGIEKNAFPVALRLIAYLEHHPEPESMYGVDLKTLYLHLADVLEGKIPIKLNSNTREFLINLIKKLNIKAKTNHTSEEIAFIQNITRLFPNVTKRPPSEPTLDSHSLNDLLNSVIYNPLEIPEELLKVKDQNFPLDP